MDWSEHAASVFTDIPGGSACERRRIRKTDRAGALDPDRCADRRRRRRAARGRALPDRIWRAGLDVRRRCCGSRNPARWFAGADGKPARAQGIVRLNNERHARDEQLVKLSRHDPLTGELNRTHLVAALAETIEEVTRFRTTCAFMLIGIDHLARINDAFGFDVADAVIAEVAKRIRTRLRAGDVLGRFSGNKFGLILKNCTVDDMNIAAERFLAGVRDEVVPTKSGPVSVTASIGAVGIPRHARSAEEAINRAQETLDGAKRRRAGSFSLWRPNVERDAQRRVNIRVTDEIVTALNERRIVMAFEPVVEAASRAPRSTNAWSGWIRATARSAGAGYRSGRRTARPDPAGRSPRARTGGRRTSGSPDVQLSLNISPDTTMDPDWSATIESLMRAHPGVAERLIVEITETVAIQDIDDVRGFITRAEEFRQPHRDRRFRRRLHLVPQSAQARRRYRENRRRLRAEHRPFRRRPRLRADPDRPCPAARNQDRRRMGAGRRSRRRCCATGVATTSRAA